MSEAIKRYRREQLWKQRDEQLGHLPAQILLDLARNESATRDWRKAAVEIMLEKGFAQVNHPDLRELLLEVKAARAAKEEVEAVVETAIEGPIEPVLLAPSAGVTTSTMLQDDHIENQ